METNQEREERLLLEIGAGMNDHFTKNEIKDFYNFLKNIKRMIEWYEFRGNYFRFEDVLYIAGMKFTFAVMNIDPKAMIKEEYKHSDRRPTEILIELPIETTMKGLKSNKIILNSKDNNFGGMFYNDFLDFIATVKGWIRDYDPNQYYGNGGGRAYDQDMYEDIDIDSLPSSKKSRFSSKKSRYDDYDEDFTLGGLNTII